MKLYAIDANIVIRYLLNDPEASRIEKLFNSKRNFLLTDVVLAEIVWTLHSFYKWDRTKIAEVLSSLLQVKNIQVNNSLLEKALEIFGRLNIDYVDAYLASYAELEKLEGVCSLDRDFNKLKEIKRLEP